MSGKSEKKKKLYKMIPPLHVVAAQQKALCEMPVENDARQLAIRAHTGQTRKNGEPYFNHPDRVARQLNDSMAKAVAYVHDVAEDCKDPTILDELNRFPEPILTAVKLLTRAQGETYFDFIQRVLASGNQTAIAVKIADLKDNLHDLEEGHKKEKYRFALAVLERTRTNTKENLADEEDKHGKSV